MVVIQYPSPRDVRKYGNVSGKAARSAVQPPREVYRIALLEFPNLEDPLILKLYGMIRQGEQKIPYDLVLRRAEFIQDELSRSERLQRRTDFKSTPIIRTETGMGYAILSSRGETLLIGTWGNDHPHVGNTYVYTGTTTRKRMRKRGLNNYGDHCAWESGVVAHEAALWVDFLSSRRRARDKRKYLDDFLEGLVFLN